MKKHITKKQWDELTDEQKLKWVEFDDTHLVENGWDKFMLVTHINQCTTAKPNIGQMIEFLGKDLGTDNKIFHIYDYDKFREWRFKLPFREEICDALWETVKEKLQ